MWVMMTTPMPWAAILLDRVKATARLLDAERGKRLVEQHQLAAPMDKAVNSIAWRWPPDRCSTLVRNEGMRVPASASALAGLRLHRRARQGSGCRESLRDLPPHEEVGDRVDVGAEREVLIDRLDARGLGVRGRLRQDTPLRPRRASGRMSAPGRPR